MLKQLIQLLVNQLVPKRAVSGEVGSKLIYGAEATEFGLPDWDSPTVIPLPTGSSAQQVYVATSSCFIVLGVEDGVTSASDTYSLIEIKSNYVTLVRSYQYNNAVNCYLKKGDTVTLKWSGSGAKALVYPLNLPN